MAKILTNGKFPENNKAPDDKINGHNTKNHAPNNYKENMEENLEQEIIED